MTAQIAVMNRVGLALASDSAVTVDVGESRKIFTSANKLFRLSKTRPVGIMIYGNAELLQVPWESIVKSYREVLGDNSFPTVSGYADDFLKFINDSSPDLFSELSQNEFVETSVDAIFEYILEGIKEKVRGILSKNGKITDAQSGKVVKDHIQSMKRRWEDTPYAEGFETLAAQAVLSKYRTVIDKAIRRTFQQLPLANVDKDGLRLVAQNVLTKTVPDRLHHLGTSGIVIAGFGEKEIFPALHSFDLDGVVDNRLHYWKGGYVRIGGEISASIRAFAQDDMVIAFMEGANPEYIGAEEVVLKTIFQLYSEEVLKIARSCGCSSVDDIRRLQTGLRKLGRNINRQAESRLKRFRQFQFTDPVVAVVDVLPKDELAAMAESLVNLTSFRRRVSLQDETVGGAVDVAVISKGDGFIWIKRKFYFDSKLNPGFVANYYKDVSHEDKGS